MIARNSDAKKHNENKANLSNRRNKVIERLKSSDAGERAAVIRHIDALLSAKLSAKHAEFWQAVKSDVLTAAADQTDPVYFADGEIDGEFVALVNKFDGLSVIGKRRMIEMFDSVEEKLIKTSGEGFTDTVRETVGDMKRFFQQRLKSSEANGGK